MLDSICNVSNATVYVHSSTEPHSASSLSVLWIEDPNRISIQRGDFVKNRVIGGGYDLYDLYEFVSEVIQSVREVWIGGSPNES